MLVMWGIGEPWNVMKSAVVRNRWTTHPSYGWQWRNFADHAHFAIVKFPVNAVLEEVRFTWKLILVDAETFSSNSENVTIRVLESGINVVRNSFPDGQISRIIVFNASGIFVESAPHSERQWNCSFCYNQSGLSMEFYLQYFVSLKK